MIQPSFRCGFLVALYLAFGLPATWASHPDAPTESHKQEHDHEGHDHYQHAPLNMRQMLLDREPPQVASFLGTTACSNGFAGTYPCHGVDLLAFMPLSTIGGGNGNDCWGWTDPVTNRRYAIMGRSSGTSFIDITDPADPIYVGNLPTHTSNSSWRDMKVYADHAFIVSEAAGHGMQVFDLRQLRSVVTTPQLFTSTAHYGGFGSAHNIAINEESGFAYAVGSTTCSQGMHIVDIRNPAAPVFAGCFSQDGYVHDTQCVNYDGPDLDYVGREICFCSNTDTLTIVDVTNKGATVQVSRTPYPGSGYTHQGWLTDDRRHFLLDDELDEQNFGHNTRTRIFDVSNLEAPTLTGVYNGTTAAIDHNLYIHEGYAYQANYRSGLRILDLANVAAGQLSEVGYFDIYPASNSANFNGAWSNYPYFGDGIVIVSGIEQGLFILQTTFNSGFNLSLDNESVGLCAPDSVAIDVTVAPSGSYSGSVQLSVDGLPGGLSAAFDVNPVPAPGVSSMTLTAGAVTPGSYVTTIDGVDGSIFQDEELRVDVANATPTMALQTTPADGATGLSRQPTLTWLPADQAFGYVIEIASDPGFAQIVYTAGATLTQHLVATPLDLETTYWWRIRGVNPCGNGDSSATFSFTTVPYPPVLLVDDDDNSPNVRPTYTAALDALGETYEIWDTAVGSNEPPVTTLAPYSAVIWITGDAQAVSTAGPGPASEAALATWLDQGGCLLLASQDYLAARGLTAFGQNYLGVASFTNNVAQTEVKGALGGVFSGVGPYAIAAPYTNRSDAVTPGAGAEVAFTGSTGNAGVSRDTGWYRTTFWGFGLEGIPGGAQQTLVETFLDWCRELQTIDGDADGTVNGEDCAPSNDTLWSVPSPARELRLDRYATEQLTWQSPAQPGAVAVSYDVLSSTTPSSFAAAGCVVSDLGVTSATDATEPLPDELLSYLIRVRNGCGGNLGVSSVGTPRSAPVCP